jgi:hypothetical protein
MQYLQTKKKIAISLGIIAVIAVAGSTMMLPRIISFGTDSEVSPTNKMPVPGNDTPERIVSGNSVSMIRNYPN